MRNHSGAFVRFDESTQSICIAYRMRIPAAKRLLRSGDFYIISFYSCLLYIIEKIKFSQEIYNRIFLLYVE